MPLRLAGGPAAKFEESKHHRGQPGNRGEFGPGGGGPSPAGGLAKRVGTAAPARRVAVAPRKGDEPDAAYRARIRAKAIANKASPEQADRVADLMTKHSRGATGNPDAGEPKAKADPVKPRDFKRLGDDELDDAFGEHASRAAAAKKAGDQHAYEAHAGKAREALAEQDRRVAEKDKPAEPEPKAKEPAPSPAVPAHAEAKAAVDKARAEYDDAANAEAFSGDPLDERAEVDPDLRAATNAARAKLDTAARAHSAAIGVKHAAGPTDVFHAAGFGAVARQNGLGFREVGIVGKDKVPVRKVTPEEAAKLAAENPGTLFHGSGVKGLASLGKGGGNMGDSVYFTPDANVAIKYAKVGGGDLYAYDGPPVGEPLDLDKPLAGEAGAKVKKAFADHGYAHVDTSGTGQAALLRLGTAIATDGPRKP